MVIIIMRYLPMTGDMRPPTRAIMLQVPTAVFRTEVG